MSLEPREPLATWLDSRARPYRVAELRDQWTEWSIRSAVNRGAAVRLLPGIIAGAAHAQEPRVRALALALWHPSLHVTGAATLHLLGVAVAFPPVADAVVPYGTRLAPCDWVRVSQRAAIRSSQRPHGVRCVIAERAVIDAWHVSTLPHARDLVYEALWARVCTASAVLRELDRMPRVRDRRALDRLLRQFLDGATSPLEVLAKASVFGGAAWSELEWQATIETGSGRRFADILHRRAGVIIELDGARYHGTGPLSGSDRQRDIELAALGYLTVRLTFRDVRDRPEWCRAMVRNVIARRLRGADAV
jgi:very-short-patch-repair endonuclease